MHGAGGGGRQIYALGNIAVSAKKERCKTI